MLCIHMYIKRPNVQILNKLLVVMIPYGSSELYAKPPSWFGTDDCWEGLLVLAAKAIFTANTILGLFSVWGLVWDKNKVLHIKL